MPGQPEPWDSLGQGHCLGTLKDMVQTVSVGDWQVQPFQVAPVPSSICSRQDTAGTGQSGCPTRSVTGWRSGHQCGRERLLYW